MARKRVAFFHWQRTVLRKLSLWVLAGLIALMVQGWPVILGSGMNGGPVVAVEVEALPAGERFYQQGLFEQAKQEWQKALEQFQKQQDFLRQALTLNYLAQANLKLGETENAARVIEECFQLLNKLNPTSEQSQVSARAWSTLAEVQLNLGRGLEALESLKQATQIYQQLQNFAGILGSQINQAQTMQALGLYRESLKMLVTVEEGLQKQPNQEMKSRQLRSLGNALRIVGDLERSKQALRESQGREGSSVEEEIVTLMSLGDTEFALGERKRAAQQFTPAFTPFGCVNLELEIEPETLEVTDYQRALSYYNQAAEKAKEIDGMAILTEIKLHQLPLFLLLTKVSNQGSQKEEFRLQAERLIDELRHQFSQDQEMPRHWMQLAQNMACFKQSYSTSLFSWSEVDQLLEKAVIKANALGDQRSESYALGKRGGLYELMQNSQETQVSEADWQQAKNFTQAAFNVAQTLPMEEISYQWEWQLGRFHKAVGKPAEAIKYYEKAMAKIEQLRKNLNAINLGFREVQVRGRLGITLSPLAETNTENPSSGRRSPFEPPKLDMDIPLDFRSKVEPVYRELIELILPKEEGTEPQENLKKARNLILSLQDAELETFLLCDLEQREQRVSVNELVQRQKLKATVIYPFVLSQGQIVLIVSFPDSTSQLHFKRATQQSQVIETLQKFQETVKDPANPNPEASEKVYEWLAKPVVSELKAKETTLVFVLNGILRNLPLAALYEGNNQGRETYLIEKHPIAISTGWHFRDARPLNLAKTNLFMGGLSEKPQGLDLPALKAVKIELEEIGKIMKNRNPQIRLDLEPNREFTRDALQKEFSGSLYQIIHLATHGQFSSIPSETFIVTAPAVTEEVNERNDFKNLVNANELDSLLRNRLEFRSETIELLVLSACQTAIGDNRGALGLAGMAIRTGASSAVASLWRVTDQQTANFMIEFYKKLNEGTLTKAEALQQVQISFIQREDQAHTPYYWAAFILLGDWL